VLVKSDFTSLLVLAESEVMWNFPLILLLALLPNFPISVLLRCSLYANRILCCFSAFPSDPSALLLADLYYTRLALCGCQEPLFQGNLMDLFEKLRPNISTGVSKVVCFLEYMQGDLYFNNAI